MKKENPIPTPEDIPPTPPPRKRKAEPKSEVLFGITGCAFPKEPESDWVTVEADGAPIRYHKKEEESFKVYYFKCPIKGTLHSVHGIGYHDEDGNRISIAAAKELVLCSYTEQYWRKESCVEVPAKENGPDATKLVSKKDYNDNYRKCDFDGKFYRSNWMKKVYGSSKHKLISAFNITHDNGFSNCPNCSRAFEKQHVQERKDLVDAPYLCITCYSAMKNHGLIQKYDYNIYPKKQAMAAIRMGAVKRADGWTATGKEEEYIGSRFFGVELEVELSLAQCVKLSIDRFVVAREIRDTLGNDFVMIKEDGSLLMNGHYNNSAKDPAKNKPTGPKYAGFEVVSCPADLEIHRSRWPALHSVPNFKVLRAWDTESCAMHVHVGKDSLTTLQRGKVLRFVNHANNKEFIQKVAGRSQRKYAKYQDVRISDILNPKKVVNTEEGGPHDQARRTAVNISNPQTIELRIFRGTVNPRHILRNLEFCDALLDFCYPCNSSFAECETKDAFLNFVSHRRKRWPLLAEWLALWTYIPCREPKEFVNPEALTLRPACVPEPENKLDGAYIPTKEEKLSKEEKELLSQQLV